MSVNPRILLAVMSALFGVVMVAAAPPTDNAPFFYAFGGLCLAIAVACVARGRVAQFCGSLIGTGVLALGVWYAVSTFTGGPLLSGRRSEPSFLNACLFLLVFGLPAAAYVWRARFGFARPPGQAFESERGLNSGGSLTSPSSGRPPAGFACLRPPLMSNVRPH